MDLSAFFSLLSQIQDLLEDPIEGDDKELVEKYLDRPDGSVELNKGVNAKLGLGIRLDLFLDKNKADFDKILELISEKKGELKVEFGKLGEDLNKFLEKFLKNSFQSLLNELLKNGLLWFSLRNFEIYKERLALNKKKLKGTKLEVFLKDMKEDVVKILNLSISEIQGALCNSCSSPGVEFLNLLSGHLIDSSKDYKESQKEAKYPTSFEGLVIEAAPNLDEHMVREDHYCPNEQKIRICFLPNSYLSKKNRDILVLLTHEMSHAFDDVVSAQQSTQDILRELVKNSDLNVINVIELASLIADCSENQNLKELYLKMLWRGIKENYINVELNKALSSDREEIDKLLNGIVKNLLEALKKNEESPVEISIDELKEGEEALELVEPLHKNCNRVVILLNKFLRNRESAKHSGEGEGESNEPNDEAKKAKEVVNKAKSLNVLLKGGHKKERTEGEIKKLLLHEVWSLYDLLVKDSEKELIEVQKALLKKYTEKLYKILYEGVSAEISGELENFSEKGDRDSLDDLLKNYSEVDKEVIKNYDRAKLQGAWTKSLSLLYNFLTGEEISTLSTSCQNTSELFKVWDRDLSNTSTDDYGHITNQFQDENGFLSVSSVLSEFLGFASQYMFEVLSQSTNVNDFRNNYKKLLEENIKKLTQGTSQEKKSAFGIIKHALLAYTKKLASKLIKEKLPPVQKKDEVADSKKEEKQPRDSCNDEIINTSKKSEKRQETNEGKGELLQYLEAITKVIDQIEQNDELFKETKVGKSKVTIDRGLTKDILSKRLRVAPNKEVAESKSKKQKTSEDENELRHSNEEKKVNPKDSSKHAGDSHWYSDLEVFHLLRVVANNIDQVYRPVSGWNELRYALREFVSSSDQNNIIIPMNVNAGDQSFTRVNHWTGLYIRREDDSYSVEYIDPIGAHINIVTALTILTELGANVNFSQPMLEGGIQDAGNVNDCGPFLVYLMGLSTHGSNIASLRSNIEGEDSDTLHSLGQNLRAHFADSINLINEDRLDELSDLPITENMQFNSFEVQDQYGEGLEGAMHTGKGLSCEAVNTNLAKIIEASSKQDIKILPKVIDSTKAATNIQNWLSNKETSELNAIVKIENNDDCLHAVTIHAKVMGSNVIVQITDSLPKEEVSFKEVLEELKAQVQSALGENSEVTIIRTGEQKEGSATCGDLSLIRISELALKNDKEYNGYTEKVTKLLSYKYDNHVFLDEKLNAQIAHANNGGMIFDSLHRAIEEGVVEEMEYGLINQCSSEDSNNEKAFNKSFYAAKKAILEAFNNQDYGLIDEILLTFDPIHRSDLLNIRYGDVGYVTGRIVRLESGSYISKAYVQQIGYNEHDVRSSDEVYSSDDQIIPLSLSFEHEGIDAVNAMRLDLDPLKFVIFDSESY